MYIYIILYSNKFWGESQTYNITYKHIIIVYVHLSLYNNNNDVVFVNFPQTFHTPSFGDEGFDIPSMGNQGNNSNTSSSCNNVSSPSNSSADSIITSHTQPQPPSLAYQHSQVSVRFLTISSR